MSNGTDERMKKKMQVNFSPWWSQHIAPEQIIFYSLLHHCLHSRCLFQHCLQSRFLLHRCPYQSLHRLLTNHHLNLCYFLLRNCILSHFLLPILPSVHGCAETLNPFSIRYQTFLSGSHERKKKHYETIHLSKKKSCPHYDRPWQVVWHPKHFHTVCLGGTHPYHMLGPLTRPLRHFWGPQRAHFGPKCSILWPNYGADFNLVRI